MKRYRNPAGDEISLYVVYSRTNRKVSHPPEICYTGAGVDILEKTRDIVSAADGHPTLSVNRLLLQYGRLRQVSFYWFKVGDAFTPDYLKEQFLIALHSLLSRPSGHALIRVSVDITQGNQAKAVGEAKEFIGFMVPNLLKFLP